MDNNSLAHIQWECKYHIVFAPKFRRKVIYGKIKADIAHILSELCKRKGIGVTIGAVIMVVGYSLGRAFIYSTPEYAVVKLPYQIL